MLVSIDENRVNLTCLYLVNYNKIVVTILLFVHLINVKFSVISLAESCLRGTVQLHWLSSSSKGELLFPFLVTIEQCLEEQTRHPRSCSVRGEGGMEGWSGKTSEYLSSEANIAYSISNHISKRHLQMRRDYYRFFWLTCYYLFQPESLKH